MSEPTKNPDEDQVLDSTTVGQVDVNIDELFGMPGAENVMLPQDQETEKPKSVFSKETVDMTFFDKTDDKKEDTPEKKVEVEEAINELNDLISQEEETGNKGRPKVDKSGLSELAAKMIEEGTLIPFDDDKPLEEYTTKDFRELFEANFQERENKIRQDTPREFFQSLPEELQYAAKYVADGGTDLKGLFRTLAQVEETRQLDPTDEYDQAEIARQYLYATNFGTAEEIESEIEDWSDMGKLEQKAQQFKPKLDKMQETIIAKQLAEQEQRQGQQAQAAKIYTDSVYDTLSVGELSGVKLDRKTQSLLYSGLVQPSYPSISGKPTNLLGHLLEKYQFVEPRHDLIAEALWLLADPDGYKGRIKDQGGKAAVEKTVRQLKTEEARKITSSTPDEADDSRRASRTQQRTLSRPNNLFKRF
jgi:uncharacterized protein YjgD (DUF1641 family)